MHHQLLKIRVKAIDAGCGVLLCYAIAIALVKSSSLELKQVNSRERGD